MVISNEIPRKRQLTANNPSNDPIDPDLLAGKTLFPSTTRNNGKGFDIHTVQVRWWWLHQLTTKARWLSTTTFERSAIITITPNASLNVSTRFWMFVYKRDRRRRPKHGNTTTSSRPGLLEFQMTMMMEKLK